MERTATIKREKKDASPDKPEKAEDTPSFLPPDRLNPRSYVTAFYSVREAGRSSYVYNTAAALAMQGYRTLILDAHLKEPSNLLLMAIEAGHGKSMKEFQGRTLDDNFMAFRRGDEIDFDSIVMSLNENLQFLPGNSLACSHPEIDHVIQMKSIGEEFFKKLFGTARPAYQHILVDAPHGLLTEEIIFRYHTNLALAVEAPRSRFDPTREALLEISGRYGIGGRLRFPVYAIRATPVKEIAQLIISNAARGG